MVDVVRAEKETQSPSTVKARHVPDRKEVPLATAACRAKSTKTRNRLANAQEQPANYMALLVELHLAWAVSLQIVSFNLLLSLVVLPALTFSLSLSSLCFALLGAWGMPTVPGSYPAPPPFRRLPAAALRATGSNGWSICWLWGTLRAITAFLLKLAIGLWHGQTWRSIYPV